MVIYDSTGLLLTTTNIIQTVNICHNENYPLLVLVKYLTILCDSISYINQSQSISITFSYSVLFLHLQERFVPSGVRLTLTTALNQGTGFI